MERHSLERIRAFHDGLSALAGVLRDTGREQQAALSEVAERFAAQTDVLARLQEGGTQLVRLQDSLQQNLAALAGAGAFEQAVDSLTAAIHLLSARTSAGGTAAGRTQGRPAA
jgi:hypothetical protein